MGQQPFARDAIAKRTDKPVFALPITVETPGTVAPIDLKSLGIFGTYTFLFCFDILSVFARKNPTAIIDAFNTAFAPLEGPVLILKALNGEKRLAELERLKMHAETRSDIVIIDEYLDYEDNQGLFAAVDCYISLHRSEGLGLTLAEAMALGKPVIGTGYSGNLDFMTEENSFLVPFDEGQVPPGSDPYRVGARWAEPNVDKAAALMRHVVEHPAAAQAIGERARRDLQKDHVPAATARFISDRYNSIVRERANWPRTRSVEDVRSAIMADDVEHDVVESRDTPPPTPPLIALAARDVTCESAPRVTRRTQLSSELLGQMSRARDDQQREFNLEAAKGIEHLARLWGELRGDIDALRGIVEHEHHRRELIEAQAAMDRTRNSALATALTQSEERVASLEVLVRGLLAARELDLS